MPEKKRPVAFVAMKFDGDHWRDKRYTAIREELENAGYEAVRADEIPTAGPVVDEVCRYLREASLVVIDSTGDSHSVSYEIGYCHGVGRPPATTLLLKNGDGLPFNYRHFRHRVYRDLRHLRRLVRDFLKVSEPLALGQYGYAFTFQFEAGGHGYILEGARCLFDALRAKKFSGRCECYSAEQFTIPGRFFTIGLMVRRTGRAALPDSDWWDGIESWVRRNISKYRGISYTERMSEPGAKRAMVAQFLPSGVAQFSDGQVIQILGAEDDSFFHEYTTEDNKA
jgi:hypothetical protein